MKDPVRQFSLAQRAYADNLHGMMPEEYLRGQEVVLDGLDEVKDDFDLQAFEWRHDYRAAYFDESPVIEVQIKVNGFWSASQISVRIDLKSNESTISHSSGGREPRKVTDDRVAAMNSGVVRVEVEKEAETIDFFSESGSCVKCRFTNYGIAGATNYPVLESALEAVGEIDGELLPEDTDWVNFDWGLE